MLYNMSLVNISPDIDEITRKTTRHGNTENEVIALLCGSRQLAIITEHMMLFSHTLSPTHNRGFCLIEGLENFNISAIGCKRRVHTINKREILT